MSDIAKKWSIARPILEPATKYGNVTIDVVERKVFSGEWQLVLSGKSAMVFEIGENEFDRWLEVVLGGGDLADLLAGCDVFEIYAKEIGCKSVYLEGRNGWSKVLQSRGYVPVNRIKKTL